MSKEPFIGKPLPQVGDIINNPDDGFDYKVVSVEFNQWQADLTGAQTYRVTLIPVVTWKPID
jgi:hypothetical protein